MSDLQTDLAAGERSEALKALRAILAGALLAVEPDKVPSLSKEMRSVLAELAEAVVPERSASDDLAARRQARRSTTTAAPGPGAGVVDSGAGSS